MFEGVMRGTPVFVNADAGFDAHLVKPVEIDELDERPWSWMDHWSNRSALRAVRKTVPRTGELMSLELGRSAVRVALTLVAIGGIALAGSRSARAEEFGYSGDDGPGFWGETHGWEACAGNAATGGQSPIDIDRVLPDHHLRALQVELHETPLALVNNGHTIEQEYEPGSSLIVEGVRYELAQFHFHTLSEHTVRGSRGVMELHAVFAAPNSDKKAVIGMLYGIGRENRFLSELLKNGLPQKTGHEISVPTQHINVADALTDVSRYFTYPGSLTTPPCSETVTWFVLKGRAELSADQFQAFRHVLGNDFRPLQKLNHRTVRATTGAADNEGGN
jgi:carbonic anhydrase